MLGRRFIPARAGNTVWEDLARPASAVHPRAGGEHGAGYRVQALEPGSSPRGRGTPDVVDLSAGGHRFIPARAGNTSRAAFRAGSSSVHPRAGGEHADSERDPENLAGSSPRGRGTLPGGIGGAAHERFIPARAGNTSGASSPRGRSPVHPRAGGEHGIRPITPMSSGGSSPRGRGTRRGAHHVGRRGRFIPARAGNTATAPRAPRADTVHPRAGGEHSSSTSPSAAAIGSSPRGRGTPSRGGRCRRSPRFIPARAGNTPCATSGAISCPVHPRAGGEHVMPQYDRSGYRGSSPRGRGTPVGPPGGDLRGRFIPARAGNTSTPRATRSRSPVHPRAGGEHSYRRTGVIWSFGSSPRGRGTRWAAAQKKESSTVHPRAGGEHARRARAMSRAIGSSPRGRGTPRAVVRPRPRHRFIPARAGNTDCHDARSRHRPVHPRAGGEHTRRSAMSAGVDGSSPRGRGTRMVAGVCMAGARFIPARAGNTLLVIY